MAELVPMVVAVMLVLLGLSYLLQTGRWINLVRRIMAAPERFFPGAVVMVAAGITVGYGYDNWDGTWPIFVTLLGWLLALKGAVFLLLPGMIMKFDRFSDGFMRIYLRLGGVFLAVLGGLLWHSLGIH